MADIQNAFGLARTAPISQSQTKAIVACDAAHHIRSWNRAAESLFGYAADEVRGQPLEVIVATADRAVLSAVLAHQRLGGGRHEIDVTAEAKGGEPLPLSLSLHPLRGPRGHLVGTTAIGRPLDDPCGPVSTPRLAHANRLLAVGQLAAGVAHEVNNPATFVLANLALLGDALDGVDPTGLNPGTLGEMKALVSDCHEGVARIARMVRDLRAFSRAEADRIEDVPLNEVARAAINITGNEVRHRARLVERFGPDVAIAADRSKLVQVATNLLLNAAHAIEPSRANEHCIEVTTGADATHVWLAVRDSGKGVPAHDAARLFDPFFTTKSAEDGTGLGLSLSLDIARQHGGDISFESTAGRGARFEMRLPRHTALRAGSASMEASPNTDASQPGRVLYVDDEPALLSMFRRLLRGHHEAVTVSSAADAVALLSEGQCFDAIVCDVMMPDMDGVAFHEAVQRIAPELTTSMAFCSGGAFTAHTRAFAEREDIRLLPKPFTREELLALITALMEAER